MRIYLVIFQVLAFAIFAFWARRTEARIDVLWAKKKEVDLSELACNIISIIKEYDFDYDSINSRYMREQNIFFPCSPSELKVKYFNRLVKRGEVLFDEEELRIIKVSLDKMVEDLKQDLKDQEDGI